MISAFALFCEDIREEKSGADTIIGVMKDNIAVKKVPTVLPKLGIYGRISFDPKEEINTVGSYLKLSDDSIVDLGEVESSLIERVKKEGLAAETPLTALVMSVVISPFRIPASGRIHMFAKVNDQEFLCGALNIITQSEAAATSASA